MTIETLQLIANSIGIDAIGVTPVALLVRDGIYLQDWIADGGNATMSYMERNIEKRIDITKMVPEARSVIVILMSYAQSSSPVSPSIRIARYALGQDYHKVVKDKLFELAKCLQSFSDTKIEGRCFVDSAPVFEHEWARRAGLGWIGNNTLLINKRLGSFTFIGCLVSNLEFDSYSSSVEADACGTCTRCVDACPTGALSFHRVHAEKCISYQTIENPESISDEVAHQNPGWIYGCDICQEVCPWNRKTPLNLHAEFQLAPALEQLTLEDWRKMTVATFKELFNHSAMQRAGIHKLQDTIVHCINDDKTSKK